MKYSRGKCYLSDTIQNGEILFAWGRRGMLGLFIYILSFFITIPFLASILVYIASMIRERNKWRAIHRTVNWTTVFYIIAVTIMLTLIFDVNFIGIILIVLLIGLSFIIFIQWKRNQDIQFRKATKLLWRVSFLVFFILYCCLTVVGIATHLLV